MKKIILLLSVLSFINTSGIAQSAELDATLKYFEKTDLPIGSEEITYKEGVKPMPEGFDLLFQSSAKKTVYPYYSFKPNDNFTSFLYMISDDEGKEELSLGNYNEWGDLVSRIKIPYDVNNGIGFNVKPDYVIEQIKFDQGQGGVYERNGNGCATYISFSNPTETHVDMYKIMPDGDIAVLDKYNALETVNIFVQSLSDGDLIPAYYAQQNKKWGSLEHFSSKKAFGGINYIQVNEIKYVSGNNKRATVFCDAVYFDSTNGDTDIKQNFIVTDTLGNWYITGMKIVKFKKRRNYDEPEGELKHLDFLLSNMTSENFDFSIEAVSYDECEDAYAGDPYVQIEGKAEYTDYNQAVYSKDSCSVYFFFTDDGKELTLTATNYKEKYKKLDMVLNKSFKIRTFK